MASVKFTRNQSESDKDISTEADEAKHQEHHEYTQKFLYLSLQLVLSILSIS